MFGLATLTSALGPQNHTANLLPTTSLARWSRLQAGFLLIVPATGDPLPGEEPDERWFWDFSLQWDALFVPKVAICLLVLVEAA